MYSKIIHALFYPLLLFGVSFSFGGYLSSILAFGIPLGAIYWLWRIEKEKAVETPSASLDLATAESEIIDVF